MSTAILSSTPQLAIPFDTYLEHCHLTETDEGCELMGTDEFRIDSQTNECMTSGWIIDNDFYIADEDRAETLTQKLWGQTIEEAYAEDDDSCFWTQWD